jgi:hypothetical protein
LCKKSAEKIAIYAHKVAKVFGDGNWKLNIPKKNQFLRCGQISTPFCLPRKASRASCLCTRRRCRAGKAKKAKAVVAHAIAAVAAVHLRYRLPDGTAAHPRKRRATATEKQEKLSALAAS